MINFNKEKTVESVIKKSENIISVFKSTVDNLLNVNQEALEQKASREDKAEALLKEAQDLGEIINKNQKVVDKIADFLNN